MPSVAMPTAVSRDWVLGNPWWWMGLGVGCCGSSWLWMVGFGQSHPAGRFALLTVGLLMAATALTIRLTFSRPAFLAGLSKPKRNLILATLMVLLGGLALAVSVVLVLAFLRPDSVPWRWGPLLVCWIIVAPMAEHAAVQCFRRLRQDQSLTEREEGAALLMLAALASFMATWALYDPADVLYMDTIRLFLSVLTLTAFVAAPLVLVPQDMRRKVISLLIVLHFIGIVATTLALVHQPKAVKQLWDRIYRPYLQFFYITNAYHFYAPEPGPASYLWFRILYVDDAGRETGEWLKLPDLDDKGRHAHATSLTYVRNMCIMEHAAPQESAPTFFDFYGRPEKFYENRLRRTPGLQLREKLTSPLRGASTVGLLESPLGQGPFMAAAGYFSDEDDHSLMMIPWHPQFTYEQQYRRPSGEVQSLLRSFARHVLKEASRKHQRVKGVKIYFVTHGILTPDVYRFDPAEPWDPHTYRAFYVGQFDEAGRLTDPHDPFLYWMLPTIRETPQRDSIYHCYIRKHAGDPAWIRNEKGRWVDAESK